MPDFVDAPLDRSWTDSAQSALGTGWRWLTTPLLPQIQTAARGISDAITAHHPDESMVGSYARGALGGAIEGVGNVLGDVTSPLGIATSVAGPLLKGVRGASTGARAAAEAMGGRSAADVLLGGPTTERQAADMLLGTQPRDSSIDDLIRQLDTTPQGSRAVTRQPPFGGSVIDANADELAARTAEARPRDPFLRGAQPSGAATDPLDARFSARPQGTRSADYARDPFASDLDTATQPDLGTPATPSSAHVDLDAAVRDLERAPHGTFTDAPLEPVEDLGHAAPDGLDALRGQFESPAEPAVETRPAAVSSPAGPDEVLRRFFRMDESPYSASGKRRLLPEEVTREQGMAATNLGEPRDVPGVPSQFRPAGGDPEIEFATRNGRYNDLPWGQRKAAIANDERYNHLLGDESGFIDPSQLPALADQANKLRYFSMLSGAGTQAKNILGNIGAVGSHAAETALSGRPRDALKVLGEFFSPQTVRDAVQEYHMPSEPGRWGDETGVLGMPGRIMGAIDRGTKDALTRGGVPEDLAHEITFTNRPKSEIGQALQDMLHKSSIGKLLVPFSKTATNIAERGLERTPGLGYLAQRLSHGALQTSLPKQILGGIAGVAGAATMHDDPYLGALLAPYSLPYALGSGMASAAEKPNSTSADVVNAAIGRLADSAPLPTKDYTLNPANYLASFVPNILAPVNAAAGIDPTTFDTRHSLTAKAVAKIPFLNELLLRHKAAAAPASAATRAF